MFGKLVQLLKCFLLLSTVGILYLCLWRFIMYVLYGGDFVHMLVVLAGLLVTLIVNIQVDANMAFIYHRQRR